MVLFKNTQTLAKISARAAKRDIRQLLLFSGYKDWDLGVHLTGDRFIRKLNREYRDKDKPTDILSFPFHQAITPGNLDLPEYMTEDDRNLGDMIISVAYVLRHCKDNKITLQERLPVLYTHGICHLLGYDHETDTEYELMSKKEEEILKQFWEWKKTENGEKIS
ncbi:hypothetical protein K7432_003872 [Basidiobolus ranarum]|uniref:Uncharacterized protein n=1 Tax=Basidiobolus ranarum TaxID=34480 RepID=A0ABR2W5J7_9FUNG